MCYLTWVLRAEWDLDGGTVGLASHPLDLGYQRPWENKRLLIAPLLQVITTTRSTLSYYPSYLDPNPLPEGNTNQHCRRLAHRAPTTRMG
jgi:hypothetical protein